MKHPKSSHPKAANLHVIHAPIKLNTANEAWRTQKTQTQPLEANMTYAKTPYESREGLVLYTIVSIQLWEGNV